MCRLDRLILGVVAVLVVAITLGPLVAGLVQVMRVPPPQHPGLVVFGLVGEALGRLGWSLGLAAVVLVVRAVATQRIWDDNIDLQPTRELPFAAAGQPGRRRCEMPLDRNVVSFPAAR
jgi:hypothetical protein